jgi:hypothetical protein
MMRWWADELDRLRDHGTAPKPDIVPMIGISGQTNGPGVRLTTSDAPPVTGATAPAQDVAARQSSL